MSYGAFAQYYDALTDNVDYEAIAGRIDEIIRQYSPSCPLVVDLACGTGTLTELLAQKGHEMIAVDGSPDMLSIASQKQAQGAIFLCQTMQRLDLYGTVGAVVCVLDSVNHITQPEQLAKVFSRVALFLEDDGVFIFDANTEYKHRSILANNVFVYDMEDIYCVWQNDTNEEKTEITLDFFERMEDGSYERSSESFCERAYSDEELTEMLETAGLQVDARYDEYSDREPTQSSQRVVYVCSKRACGEKK